MAAVREVLRHRGAGLSLATAVRRVSTGPVHSRSVFAEVRRLHPELAPRVLSKRTLTALSRAIEDECCARAAEPLLFGGFQREEFRRRSHRRWHELARTARAAVTFAHGSTAAPAPGPLTEVRIPEDSPLRREWFVVCDATDLPACLAAVEMTTERPVGDEDRRFETVWSVDPQVVRDASRVAAALADDYEPAWREPGAALPDADDPAPASADVRRAHELFDRMLGYLDARG